MLEHYHEDRLLCPHCDAEQEYVDADIYNLSETLFSNCEKCNKVFKWYVVAYYSSSSE